MATLGRWIAQPRPSVPVGIRRWRHRMGRAIYARDEVEETCGVIDLADVGLDHPDRVEYRPSGYRGIRRTFRALVVGPGDVFLDIGCGKGRVLREAARRPFARVIGVEIAAGILDVARRNLEHREDLACQHVDLVCADASAFEVPDDVTHVYLYNPILGDAFRAALASLIRSLDRRPRRLTLVYRHPTMAGQIDQCGRFDLVRRLPPRILGRDRESVSIYVSR